MQRAVVIKSDVFQDFEGRLYMDATSTKCLEVFVNRRNTGREGSLLNVIDKTKTKMGTRFLSAQLMLPLADANLINERLDAVEGK